MNVFLETYGCQMNVYDSELVRSILHNGSFSMTEEIEDADVVLLNTCAIRESAHDRIFGRLGHLHGLKRKNPRLVVGLLGCMAQSLKNDVLEKNPMVDLVAGPDSYKKLPRLIHSVYDNGQKGMEIGLSEYETYSDVAPERIPGVNAWIACMRGCDNFCTFCVVPYTRGRERSRDPEGIVEETRQLVAQGFKQVTLLGQNVNSYRHEGSDFGDLLLRVADVPGIERVRFTSPHPKDFPVSLLRAIASHEKICSHIHLPLQAGSTRLLEMMRRTYSKQEFLDLVDMIRDTIPDICLSTDIICGFPTESEADFEDTLEVVDRVQFESAFVFKYSERKNTIAQRKFADDVDDATKVARVVRLNEMQKAITLRKLQRCIGKTLNVLLETRSRKSEDDLLGRDDGFRSVVVPRGDYQPGDLVPVTITAAASHTLLGHIEDHPARQLPQAI